MPLKRLVAFFLIPLCLIGCKQKNLYIDELYSFRQQLLQSDSISFDVDITADYSEEFYTFQLSCVADDLGNLSFDVLQPDSIQGIQGVVTQDTGHITFDEHVLLFKSLADDRLTPVSAPWVLITALRGGYITSSGKSDNGYLAVIQDTYEEDPLTLQIQFEDNKPIWAEIYWNQARVITMEVSNFTGM